MGGALSSEDDGDDVIGREYGFRVHRVEANSPGQLAGLQSILDYIVVANGVRLSHDDGNFVRMIAESKGKPMKLTVYNTHTQNTRETMLTPDDGWGGTGLVGITIRFDVAQSLSKHTLHVLDVFDDSPASAAELDAFNDYILGVGDLLYDGPDEFGEIVMHNEGRPLRLYVYSITTESVREVIITPDRGWGGDGSLGCDVGSGYLHTLPARRTGRAAARKPQPAAAEVVAAPPPAAPPVAMAAPPVPVAPVVASADAPPPQPSEAPPPAADVSQLFVGTDEQ